MTSNLLPIAKEGFKYIAYALALLIISMIFDFDTLSFILFIALVVFLYIFRNPEREIRNFTEEIILSPVDGTIIDIEKLKSDKEYSYKISIQSTYKDISILRVPFSSSIISNDYINGARLSNLSTLCTKLNERVELIFEDKKANRLKINHMLTQGFDTIQIFKEKNLTRSDRYGFMLNGVSTIYMPLKTSVDVELGDTLLASSSVIGKIK